MILDGFLGGMRQKVNASIIGMPGGSEIDLAFLDSQKNQHK